MSNTIHNCLDIDECLSSPCGTYPNISCTNFLGMYYECSCDEGFLLEETNKTCIGMYAKIQVSN